MFFLAPAAPYSQLSLFGGEFVFYLAAAAVISLLLVICCIRSSEENSYSPSLPSLPFSSRLPLLYFHSPEENSF